MNLPLLVVALNRHVPSKWGVVKIGISSLTEYSPIPDAQYNIIHSLPKKLRIES